MKNEQRKQNLRHGRDLCFPWNGKLAVIVHNEPLNEEQKCGFTELVMKRLKCSVIWHWTCFQKRVDEPDLAHPMTTLTRVPFQFALTCLGVAKFAELVYTRD